MVLYFNTICTKATMVFNKQDINKIREVVFIKNNDLKDFLRNKAILTCNRLTDSDFYVTEISEKNGCIKLKVEVVK